MANFQDSRFLGFSSRTLWVSLAVVGVVVGLFFIPEIIKFQFSPRTGTAASQRAGLAKPTAAPRAQASEARSDRGSDQRAALAPGALRELSTNLETNEHAPTPEPQRTSKPRNADADSGSNAGGGFFSGWNMKVRARGENNKDIAKGISMDNLANKDAAGFFKRGRGEILKFIDRNNIKDVNSRDAVNALAGGMDPVINGIGKNTDQAEVAAALGRLHIGVVRQFGDSGMDRGTLLEWLNIPVIKLIDDSRGGNVAKQLATAFQPRIVLRSLSVRQRAPRGSETRPTAILTAELAVRGNDVESIGIFNQGQRQRDLRPGRPDVEGYRSFKVRGDATGNWAFVAYDKYGARPFGKSYSFYPRVRRFRLNYDGTFNIAFQPNSARNSLDRFFAVAVSKVPGNTGDPAVTVF